MSHSVLAFQNTTFNVVDRNGAPWLRAQEIAVALGYADSKGIHRIYARQSEEFTSEMTGVVKLTTPCSGGDQETRIFSLRGAHLLAMFARTEIAKQFRVWVLDLLDREATRGHLGIGTPTVSLLQKRTLKKIVDARVAELVQNQPTMLRKISTASLYQMAWRKFHNRFTISEYAALPACQFDEARKYLNSVKLDLPTILVADKSSSLASKEYREQALSAVNNFAASCRMAVEQGQVKPPEWPTINNEVLDGFLLDAIRSARFEVYFDENLTLKMTAMPPQSAVVAMRNKESLEALVRTGIPAAYLPDLMRIALSRMTPTLQLA